MRLGFDLDGTLADMQAALVREARRLFPDLDLSHLLPSSPPDDQEGQPDDAAPERPNEPPPSALSLSSRQQRALWKAVQAIPNFWDTLDEIEPGALERLSRLVHDHRWELIFLTNRPETSGDTAQLQSHRWLERHGFRTPNVFVVRGSRGRIANALSLDVIVDDRPENCLDVVMDSKARAVLVWRADQSIVPVSARGLGIAAVKSVAEVLDILEQADRAGSTQGTIFERLKRLFGLKTLTDLDRAARPAR